jgi:hypothetical protein
MRFLTLACLLMISSVLNGCATAQPASVQAESSLYPKEYFPAAGSYADYSVASPEGGTKPRVISLRITYIGAEGANCWWQFTVHRLDGSAFSVQWLTTNAQPFAHSSKLSRVLRYILQSNNREPLEYRDAVTGDALLPEWNFFTQLLPKADSAAKWQNGFFDKGAYLTWPITQTSIGANVTNLAQTPPRRLDIDSQVVSGTTNSVRDINGKRLFDDAGQPREAGVKDYTYREMSKADIDEQLAVGRNYFWASANQVEYLLDKPAFFDYRDDYAKVDGVLSFPEALYRSNFSGCSGYIDEPSYLFMRDNMGKLTESTPAEAARRMSAEARAIAEGRSPAPRLAKYSRVYLENQFRGIGYALGNFHFFESSLPIFEASLFHAWYDMESGAPGIMYESGRRFTTLAAQAKELYGVDLPSRAADQLRLQCAVLRGAARNFGGYWGIGIYGELDPQDHDVIFRMAYARGATRFLFYTLAASAHVPYAEQLAATQALREYAAAHPRPSWQKLRDAATVCLVLPDGYHDGPYVHRWKALWGQPQSFGLDSKNAQGITYRQVLTRFNEEVKQLLQSRDEFDVAVDSDSFHPRGYKKLIYILGDATVKIVTPTAP